MTYETLDWAVDADGVATLTLNRPESFLEKRDPKFTGKASELPPIL